MLPYAKRRTITAFGDSITERGTQPFGWTSLLSQHYSRRADILNRGYSGYNTRQALFLLRKHIQQKCWPHSQIYTLFFGANDASIESRNQHISLKEFEQNLREIIDILTEMGGSVLLLTPPAVDDEGYDKFCRDTQREEGTRSNSRAQEYAKKCVKVAENSDNVICIDLWNLFMEQKNYKCLLSDGLHLSVEGNKLVAEAVCGVIDGGEEMGVLLDAPEWSKFNPNSLEESWKTSQPFFD